MFWGAHRNTLLFLWGTVVARLRCCATNQKVSGSIPAGVIGFFVDIKSFRLHYGPGVDSASNRNEYQEYFLGVKIGRCVRLTTYHHPVPLSQNLGTLTSWNPLGHSRPVMGLIYLTVPVVPAEIRAHTKGCTRWATSLPEDKQLLKCRASLKSR